MISARRAALGIAAASAAAMLYVGLYQVRAVKTLICPLFGGCEQVADAPFARPFGVPDGFIAAGFSGLILVQLLVPAPPLAIGVCSHQGRSRQSLPDSMACWRQCGSRTDCGPNGSWNADSRDDSERPER